MSSVLKLCRRSIRYDHLSHKVSRMVSTTCRGGPISGEQLFTYTNGRFLMNEEHQMSKRYAAFEIDNLCALISSLPSIQSPVVNIDKLEGGFNKALVMRMENGKEAIVKIPFPSSVPLQRATESEVAVLDYVRSKTSLPVPEVLAWNSDSSNPVGTEYIVLEKVSGKQLNEVWDEMTAQQRFRLVTSLAQFDGELSKTPFPAYGNLYHRIISDETINLPPTIDPENKYCIGPAVRPIVGPATTRHDGDGDELSGPWNDLAALSIARAKVGMWNLSHAESKTKIMVALAPLLNAFSVPILWHPDSHMGNIFVSVDDYTKVVGLIDWQFAAILPTLTQARWPLLLNVPEDYETGPSVPKLPTYVDNIDSNEQDELREKYEEEVLAKCYEIALNKANPHTGSALSNSPEPVRQLLILCTDTYKDGIVPLRDCLIKISNFWEASGFPGLCPIQFTSTELHAHQAQLAEYREWCALRKYTFDVLSTDEEGWVPPQLTFEAIRAYERKLFQLYMDSQEPGTVEEKARALWFFTQT